MRSITANPLEIETKIVGAVESIIQDQDWDGIHVESEFMNKGFSITKVNESGWSPFNRSDITIYQEREWSPPELDEIENISRWFPDKTLDVPLVELEIREGPDISSPVEELWISPPNHILKGIIQTGSLEEPGISTVDGSSAFVFRIKDREDLQSQEFADLLVEHIDHYRTADIYTDEELEEKISRFKPEVFHFNEVFSAYNSDRTKVLIILLSVFFEGYIEDLIKKAMEDARENEEATSIYESWDFKESLNACRFFGLISENDYRIIDQIRDERNDYAHEHEKYHPDIQSTVSESGTLTEAIELYEEIIGVEDSMLTS